MKDFRGGSAAGARPRVAKAMRIGTHNTASPDLSAYAQQPARGPTMGPAAADRREVFVAGGLSSLLLLLELPLLLWGSPSLLLFVLLSPLSLLDLLLLLWLLRPLLSSWFGCCRWGCSSWWFVVVDGAVVVGVGRLETASGQPGMFRS